MDLTPPFVRGHDHALGDSGPVLVLFGDYEDADSAAADRAVQALRERWDGFTYVWRHLPIGELHPHANGAALAAEGAAAQDAFWAYHHVLLARQNALSVPDLLNYAGQIGLEVSTLMEDMQAGAHAERVLDDVRSAVNSGLKGTPGIFVEGVRWEGGWEPDALEGVLRAALAG
jgi:protein-disulfide isomerase